MRISPFAILRSAILLLILSRAGDAATLPSVAAATRVEVTDLNQRFVARITSRQTVAAIVALIDTQRDWHGPAWEKPVGSLHLAFSSHTGSVAVVEYRPRWLLRAAGGQPYYTRLSHADDDKLLRLLKVRREDLP